jgi:toxin ParE1/3/4
VKLLLSAEARVDIAEAIEWLHERSPELPSRFRTSLDEVIANIADHPAMSPTVHRDLRRALLRRFPYAVFYVVEGETVAVIGVIHQARHPSTWRRRT